MCYRLEREINKEKNKLFNITLIKRNYSLKISIYCIFHVTSLFLYLCIFAIFFYLCNKVTKRYFFYIIRIIFYNIAIFSFSYFDQLIDDYSFHDRSCSSVLHVCNNLSDTQLEKYRFTAMVSSKHPAAIIFAGALKALLVSSRARYGSPCPVLRILTFCRRNRETMPPFAREQCARGYT